MYSDLCVLGWVLTLGLMHSSLQTHGSWADHPQACYREPRPCPLMACAPVCRQFRQPSSASVSPECRLCVGLSGHLSDTRVPCARSLGTEMMGGAKQLKLPGCLNFGPAFPFLPGVPGEAAELPCWPRLQEGSGELSPPSALGDIRRSISAG